MTIRLPRNPKFLSAMAVLLLVALIWFGGSSMGLPSLEGRFTLVFLIMLAWAMVLMAGKRLTERSSALLEKVLRRHADLAVVSAEPGNRTETALLRQRLLAAIDLLKTSRLGRTKGRAALYELPWYMILGHPAAGKTCALLHSGLSFPLQGRGAPGVQGVGGTRNCDWIFTTEGVLLDTAGRYASQREDHPEWLEFLKLLKRHRSRAPVNGILVATSLSDLLDPGGEAFTAHARQVRQRVSEMEAAFGMRIPLYLIVTKMDLLDGFSRFFEDLTFEASQQVWGATLSHDQGPGFDAVRVVERHFDGLHQGLVQMGCDKLGAGPGPDGRPALYTFPVEFRGLREALLRFTERLVEDDPFHSKPLIRGFYFTSALQEGTPSVAAGHRVSDRFDVGFRPGEGSQVRSSRPYFLENLFRQVIFPDKFLLGNQAGPARDRVRLALLWAGGGLLLLLAGAWTQAFRANARLIEEASGDVVTARQSYGRGDLLGRLQALHTLQVRLEGLDRTRREGTIRSLGLYQGREVERILRAKYFAGLSRTMLDPVRMGLEARLEAPAGGPRQPLRGSGRDATTELTTALKTYLMLHGRDHLEGDHLFDQLPRWWRPALERAGPLKGEVAFLAEQAVAYYVSQIREPDLPLIEIRSGLVDRARLRIKGDLAPLPALDRIYGELKSKANVQFAPVSVGLVLGGRDGEIVGGSYQVQGSFTREARERFFRQAIQEAARGDYKGVDWVLATPMAGTVDLERVEENRERLEALYRAEYAEAWTRFLQGVAIRDFEGPRQAAAAFVRLADPRTSPLRLILARVHQETAPEGPAEARGAGRAMLERTGKLLGARPGASPARKGEAGSRFASLGALLEPGPGGKAPLDGYLEQLQRIRLRFVQTASAEDPSTACRVWLQATASGGGELNEALQGVETSLLAGLEDPEALRPMVVRPLTQALRALLPGAATDINRAWAQQVYGPWSALASRFPFSERGPEASSADLTRLLRPGDGALARFREQVLGPLVQTQEDRLTGRSWAGQPLVPFAPGFLGALSQAAAAGAVLQDGEPSRFDLQVMPTPGLSEVLVEVDGRRQTYRNGPPLWVPFVWPGPGEARGARLEVVSNTGIRATVHASEGPLAFLRLLDRARADHRRGQTCALGWRFKAPPVFTRPEGSADERLEESYPHPVQVHFRLTGGPNPLQFLALRNLALPARATH